MSFDEFFGESFAPLTRFVMRMGARTDEAEDVVQEVMFQAYRKWNTLETPRAWCYRAASTEFTKVIRRRMQEDELLRAIGAVRTKSSSELPHEYEAVRGLIRGLPPAQREALAYTFDGYKPTEIAQIVGKSAEAVRANLREARKRLRQALEEKPDV